VAVKRKPKRDEDDIESRIVSVDEAGPYVKLLVYGRNGSGKTRFAASGPKCLLIDIHEQGTRSARGSGAKVFPNPNGKPITWPDIGQVYWYLAAGNHPYETVAIDTVTAMNRLCLEMVMGEAEDRDPNREIGLPDRRAYGRAGELMRSQLLAFRNLNMHVVFTAQERVIKDEDTDEPVLHTPDLPAGSRGIAMGSVGIIGRIYSQQVRVRNKTTKKIVERWEDRLLVGPHEEYDTKDRTNALGSVVRRPTMTDIIRVWNEA
jgi:hypothetical protein